MLCNLFYTFVFLSLLSDYSPLLKFSSCIEPLATPNTANNTTFTNVIDEETPKNREETLEGASADYKDRRDDKQSISKDDLSKEAYRLENGVKYITDEKQNIEKIERIGDEIKRKLNDSNGTKLQELINKRNQLLIKISSLGKTLRIEHDAVYPELRGEPIIVIAKNEDDEKRKANQLAHLDGFEDFVHKISSPCSILEDIRKKSLDSTQLNAKDKFKMEQRTLDSMNAQDRLNYDNNMIEHYESLMQELVEGIHKVNDEIEGSWHNYSL
ncbi:hypothetical protein BEWA_019010 [Theileria equi strain WA]|uniref:Signal peptide containing protein n=1 Tax=Theileria equi strain WA TaxID=1537102 RepID=L0AVK6_THEEQ|nr:hypothetical protein BEWA_019010 [Theileria equi strain WA]AFZ79056.1 hypothetical protein BEWA_019010 [Theileria equi strain WA]|eukprot:XP_004828722.1 hypothetical protein BEWA_019010 [Theileria equi strain WA]